MERQVVLAARPALDAWHHRGLDGTVTLGANEAPAKVMAGVLSLEFLVHAWDYAKATGRDVAPPDALVGLRDGSGEDDHHTAGTQQRRVRRSDRCAADAGALDRLIAYTGRTAELVPFIHPSPGEIQECVVLVRGGDGDAHAVLAVRTNDDAGVGRVATNSAVRSVSGSQTKFACDGGTA